jgi:hypothetical protein
VSSVAFFIPLSPLIPSGQSLSRLVGPMSADSPSLPHPPPAFFPATLVTDDPPPLRSPKASQFSSNIGGSSPPSSPFDRALSLHSRYQRSPLLLTIPCHRIEKSGSILPDPHPPSSFDRALPRPSCFQQRPPQDSSKLVDFCPMLVDPPHFPHRLTAVFAVGIVSDNLSLKTAHLEGRWQASTPPTDSPPSPVFTAYDLCCTWLMPLVRMPPWPASCLPSEPAVVIPPPTLALPCPPPVSSH